ncbi:MAG: dTMP kinase [Actinomycetota bacterium]|nr:dTMP kinase [Actinomycetota bacterium]
MPTEPPRGRFLVIEGGDGVGKTTQVAAVAEALSAAGVAVRPTREPGGTELGERIRALLAGDRDIDPAAEALLLLAARAQHCAQVIGPALARGEWVLSDRFDGSFYAYQGYGRGLPLPELEALNKFAAGDIRPDLTILLANGAAGAHRGLDGSDRFERMGAGFQARVEEGYLVLAERHGWEVVDSHGSRSDVTRRILEAIDRRLGAQR